VEAHQPHAVLLQECAEPGDFGHGFIAEQLQGLGPLGYRLLQQGEFLTAVLGASARAVELPPLRRQAGKLHAVHSPELNSVILNAHLGWDRMGSEAAAQTRQDIEAVLAHLRELFPGAQVLLAGDTNRVPAAAPRTDPDAETIEQLADGLGQLCPPPGPTNVRWSGAERGSELTYADFALRCPAACAAAAA